MSFLKALCISFAIYSKIPVPHFDWKEREMRYQLIFFPWVGAVIGALMYLWNYVCLCFAVGETAKVLIMTAIPLLVTGGFHVDGFMDTMDAIKSYKTKEEKLEILKDPHIGAFSVLMLACLGLIYIGAMSQVSEKVISCLGGGYFLSRTLSGIGVIIFPNARKSGMLNTFNRSANAAKRTVLIALVIEGAACCGFMIIMNSLGGILMTCAALLVFVGCRQMSLKHFGGITGDTAGYFVTVCETVMVLLAAAVSIISQ